jgi:hypothetical protein
MMFLIAFSLQIALLFRFSAPYETPLGNPGSSLLNFTYGNRVKK